MSLFDKKPQITCFDKSFQAKKCIEDIKAVDLTLNGSLLTITMSDGTLLEQDISSIIPIVDEIQSLVYDVSTETLTLTTTNNVYKTTIPLPNVSLVQNSLFVDSTYGDDATGSREDPNLPYQTIDGAYSDAQAGDTVYLKTGTHNFFTGSSLLLDNVVLKCEPGVTIDLGNNFNSVFFDDFSAKNLRLEGFPVITKNPFSFPTIQLMGTDQNTRHYLEIKRWDIQDSIVIQSFEYFHMEVLEKVTRPLAFMTALMSQALDNIYFYLKLHEGADINGVGAGPQSFFRFGGFALSIMTNSLVDIDLGKITYTRSPNDGIVNFRGGPNNTTLVKLNIDSCCKTGADAIGGIRPVLRTEQFDSTINFSIKNVNHPSTFWLNAGESSMRGEFKLEGTMTNDYNDASLYTVDTRGVTSRVKLVMDILRDTPTIAATSIVASDALKNGRMSIGGVIEHRSNSGTSVFEGVAGGTHDSLKDLTILHSNVGNILTTLSRSFPEGLIAPMDVYVNDNVEANVPSPAVLSLNQQVNVITVNAEVK